MKFLCTKSFTEYNAAYGSNLSISQMTLRCPDAEIIETGKIMDYKLVFRKSHKFFLTFFAPFPSHMDRNIFAL